MDLKLNIYSKEKDEKTNKRKITKTYTTNTYELLYGTVEDVLQLFDKNELKTSDDYIAVIKNAKNQVNDLLKDIFVGLTDEEIKMANFDEICIVIIGAVRSSISEISSKIKNVMRG